MLRRNILSSFSSLLTYSSSLVFFVRLLQATLLTDTSSICAHYSLTLQHSLADAPVSSQGWSLCHPPPQFPRKQTCRLRFQQRLCFWQRIPKLKKKGWKITILCYLQPGARPPRTWRWDWVRRWTGPGPTGRGNPATGASPFGPNRSVLGAADFWCLHGALTGATQK